VGNKTIASWIRASDDTWFHQVFSHYPDLRLENARVGSVDWTQTHGLLLTGGSDISEKYLRQPVPSPALIRDPDPVRDAWEFDAVKQALEHHLPVFAICRGLQILNVALGGSLLLDIPGHDSAKNDNVQPLRYASGVPPLVSQVNSSHHQAIDRLGEGLVGEAWHTGDGVLEQARLKGRGFCLGVQFHPERDPLYQPLFDAFATEVRKHP
jgi:putative glutamine amidotransferase